MTSKVSYEGKQSLRWMRVAGCMVTYMEPNVDFADADWDEWIAAFSQDNIRSLVIGSWDPTQPTHQQWRRATRAMRDRELPVSVISEARHNLALAKAASWLGTDMQSFRWTEINDALKRIGLDPQLVPAVRAKIVALRDAHGQVASDVTLGASAPPRPRRRSYEFSQPLEVSADLVQETNSEIQATLESLQKRLKNRSWNSKAQDSG
ncbi:hypothetical protein G6O69_07240 [Pseudenhygromyxa sp. WMMC2535]|uniref:hypothetical protein n=1 Tax=Pseudenhygromyxa sp. WMMC2535 TaxID=2712867 RepID=UPI0015581E0F|nr:hypothetical protein [Pseudenhygromyxa sp. WMMC2535]NVB37621.1 hypothetical protein [Pseudenhygromyxa sp. WMMC2535]